MNVKSPSHALLWLDLLSSPFALAFCCIDLYASTEIAKTGSDREANPHGWQRDQDALISKPLSRIERYWCWTDVFFCKVPWDDFLLWTVQDKWQLNRTELIQQKIIWNVYSGQSWKPLQQDRMTWHYPTGCGASQFQEITAYWEHVLSFLTRIAPAASDYCHLDVSAVFRWAFQSCKISASDLKFLMTLRKRWSHFKPYPLSLPPAQNPVRFIFNSSWIWGLTPPLVNHFSVGMVTHHNRC